MKRVLRIGLTFAVSVLFLYLALQHVSFDELWQHIRRTQLGLLVVAGILHAAKFYLIGVRWGVLLDHVKRIPRLRLYPVVAITYMANNVLPLRAGEVLRVFVLGQREGLSKSAAFGTVIVERALDGVALLAMFLIACAVAPVPKWLWDAALGVCVLLLVVVAVLVGLVFLRRPTARLLHAVLQVLPGAFGAKLDAILARFVDGLDSVRSPVRIAVALGLTVAHWVSEGFVYYLTAVAMGVPLGYAAALFVTVVVNVGILLPSSPGYVGPFEYFGQQAGFLMGIEVALATAYAVVTHVVIYLPITFVGLVCFVLEGTSVAPAKPAVEKPDTQ